MDKILYTPRSIYDWLINYVKGQDVPLRKIATALSIHINAVTHEDDNVSRSNILIAGSTGCGKTETVRALSEMDLPFPVIKFDALDYSVGAWHGKSLDDVFTLAYRQARKIVSKNLSDDTDDMDEIEEMEMMSIALDTMSHSVIVIDEFDKLARRSGSDSSDAFLSEYQYTLLGLLEGKEVPVKVIEGKNGENGKIAHISTSQMLFVMMGAFSGLDEITQKRVAPPSPIGFCSADSKTDNVDLTPSTEDLIDYGFSRELIGRIPIRAKYNSLTVELLVNIMQNAANSPIKKMQERANTLGCNVVFSEESYAYIAKKALELNTGARGIENILIDLLYDSLYEAADGLPHRIAIDDNASVEIIKPVNSRRRER